MSTYIEAEHPRAETGRFVEKDHSAPELELEVAGEAPTPVSPSYFIRAARLPEAVARIEKANRRLARYGINERFEYETRTYIETADHSPLGVEMVELTMNRPRISAGEWEFVSAHEATADGHIVSYGELTTADMRCDHCGHKRQRGKTYTVRHPETGETVQVGSNCIAKFLGVRPEGLWALEFEAEDAGEEDEEYAAFKRGERTAGAVVPARELIVYALAASGDGSDFVPYSRASTETPATAYLVFRDLDKLIDAEHTVGRQRLADEVLAWVNRQPDSNDYIRNLRTVLAGEERWVGTKHFGIAASAISAYNRSLEERVAKQVEEDAYTPGFIAPVGERVRDVPVEILKTRGFAGDYGDTTLVSMRAADGRIVKWFASGDYSRLQPGTKMTMTATVKAHGQYDGKDETSVSRAKLVPVEAG